METRGVDAPKYQWIHPRHPDTRSVPENPDEVKVSRPSDSLAARQAADEMFTALLLGSARWLCWWPASALPTR